LTDFGLEDEYVGVMKGVILSINPRVDLIDITHNITRHDIRQAALTVDVSFRYFPKGSIHVIVVDPGVGGNRKVLCLQQEGHFFVAPDNGVLTMVVQDGRAEKICSITNKKYFLKPVSDTFHGRDIFAPAAAHLSKGIDMLCLGQEIPLSDITRLDVPAPFVSATNELVGAVILIDHFGNLVTNISEATFERFKDGARSREVVIRLGRSKIQGVSKSYDSVKIGSAVAVFGSRNLLEISLNQGDARTYFKARIGQAVRVKL
ncbi:MAG: SAM-dependent chlorinase/fluorinase, partial [Deltaproteobacteria bacterium]|nr:SAM-dependent chlorinase/fluorinase [Deltaproteobacteria bacterium]MBW2331810.1 SAM-dependent chlorinase/fluorinase [Deltaproteobacteria bacterium]